MARTLDLGVIAEGVETPEQAEKLRALGCERAQGYWFGRPQPAAAITSLLQTGSQDAPTMIAQQAILPRREPAV